MTFSLEAPCKPEFPDDLSLRTTRSEFDRREPILTSFGAWATELHSNRVLPLRQGAAAGPVWDGLFGVLE